MTFEEYQKEAEKTAVYPVLSITAEKWFMKVGYLYPVIGLAGETGEVFEKLKKIIRDENGVIDDLKRHDLAKEIGDILWYTAMLCKELDLSFEDVAKANLAKLKDRQERELLHGEGDNR